MKKKGLLKSIDEVQEVFIRTELARFTRERDEARSTIQVLEAQLQAAVSVVDISRAHFRRACEKLAAQEESIAMSGQFPGEWRTADMWQAEIEKELEAKP